MLLLLLTALIGTSFSKKDNKPSCDLFSMIEIGTPFLKWAECQAIAIKVMTQDPPSNTEMCNCYRNARGDLEKHQDHLQCTLWPNSGEWRSKTLYEKIVEYCVDSSPEPDEPWIAKSKFTFLEVHRSSDDASQIIDAPAQLSEPNLVIRDQYVAGIRFDDTRLQPGTSIKNAFLALQPAGSTSNMNNTIVSISAEDTINSHTFSTSKTSITGRSLSKKSTFLTVYEDLVPGSNAMFSDVQPLVQPLVKKNGWVPSDPITFILDWVSGTGGLSVSSRDNSLARRGPLLIVQYLDKVTDKPVAHPTYPTPRPTKYPDMFPTRTNPSRDDQNDGGSGKKNEDGDVDDSGDGGLSGGSKAGIAICVLLLIAVVAYGAHYYFKNKTLFTSFSQEAQFQPFSDSGEAASGYSPPDAEAGTTGATTVN